MAARVQLREVTSEEGKDRPHFLEFCHYIRSLHPATTRLHFILDNFSPHHGRKMRDWATMNNVELAYTPHYVSWLNRIEAQFRALRYFTLAGTDHRRSGSPAGAGFARRRGPGRDDRSLPSPAQAIEIGSHADVGVRCSYRDDLQPHGRRSHGRSHPGTAHRLYRIRAR